MPYKDPEKRKEMIVKSQEKIYAKTVYVRIRHDSGMSDPLDRAAEANGQTVSAYMQEAAREKLIRDGYMTESDSQT